MELEKAIEKVKTYLENYNNWIAYMDLNDKEIENCVSRLSTLDGSPKSPKYSFMPRSGNGNSGQPESEYVQREQLQSRIKDLENKNYGIWLNLCRVDSALKKLEETDRNIVSLKWKDKKTWYEISLKTNSSINYCRKHHDCALRMLASIMFGAV